MMQGVMFKWDKSLLSSSSGGTLDRAYMSVPLKSGQLATVLYVCLFNFQCVN